MKLITKKEAAELLGGVSTKTVERLIAAGKLDKYTIGTVTVRLDEEDVLNYIAGQRTCNIPVKQAQEKVIRRNAARQPVDLRNWKPGDKLV